MIGQVPPLLLGLGAAFLLLSGGALLLLARSARTERRDIRIATVVDPHRPAEPPPVPAGLTRLLADRRADLVGVLARVFGFSVERAPDYPVRWWIAVLAALPVGRAAAGLLASLAGDIAVLATPVLWVLVARAFFSWCERQRLDLLYRQFPDALAMVVRMVRVGIPVTEGIRTIAREMPEPTAREFSRLADRLAVGMPLDEALAETAAKNGLPEYRFFATALTLQAQTGGGLAETLDNLADVIRKRVALRARANALASEAKTSAGILTAVPFFTAAALAVLSPNYIRMLFEDEGGQQVLGIAIGMLLLGVLSMRSIIRRSLS